MLGPELQKSALSVSAVAFFISNMLKDHVGPLLVRGEISGLRQGARGSYLYYSLIDGKAKIDCLTHNSSNGAKVLKNLQDGDEVIVLAQPNFYAAGGKLSFFSDEVMRLGEGIFASAYEKLKQKLYQEGLFKESLKKPLPIYPECIGVVTSAEGAVLQDIIRVANDRWPLAEILVFPALVQGEKAPNSLHEALSLALTHPLDAIIIGRGGGSSEDLSAFNDEALVRLIHGAEIPIVSAVGHETDTSLCDYAADYSAPTPTGAAMKLFPDKSEVLKDISRLGERMQLNYTRYIKQELYEIESLMGEIRSFWQNKVQSLGSEVLRLRLNLENANPETTLKRGYAVLLDDEGRRAEHFSPKQQLNILTSGHKIKASVNEAERR